MGLGCGRKQSIGHGESLKCDGVMYTCTRCIRVIKRRYEIALEEIVAEAGDINEARAMADFALNNTKQALKETQ